jgi:hypothetical protein
MEMFSSDDADDDDDGTAKVQSIAQTLTANDDANSTDTKSADGAEINEQQAMTMFSSDHADANDDGKTA